VSFSEPKCKLLVMSNQLIRVLLQKLIFFKRIKNFPSLYGDRRFVTTFTTACRKFCCSIIHPIIISFPKLSVSKRPLRFRYSDQSVRCAHCPSHLPWFDHPDNICSGVQIMSLHILEKQFSPASSCFLFLMFKYFPQHSLLFSYMFSITWLILRCINLKLKTNFYRFINDTE